ncbi:MULTISPECIES: hybrid sensor histidine kinase/response regulator [unclassified Sulfurimonas]|uniref:hybrid sensor histidine kinase/response regulator n=1 Tax=unclassified Sulfurimonas TaxID=2623549 RepID=UPI0025E4EF32|nr:MULTISPECIES: hybrid sensor histidine kinase/response regulator [unclassified Sulfurimonas]
MDKLDKPSVLVIDDTPDILSLIMELLKGKYALKLANSPKKALDLLQNKPKIDLILLDIMMPEIDGYEMCKIIKNNPLYINTPIIFLTALEKTSDIVKGFECGAVDYITKPFIPEVLKARVKTHVELKLLHDNIINDLEAKEEMLFRQSRMTTLGEMFENVTHQWKQPLSVINMSCSIQKINYDLGEFNIDEVIETLDTVISETEYLSQTIDDFRDFARNDAEKEIFDIRDIFTHAVEILSYRFNKISIEIYNEIDSFKYRSYKNYIIQIVINILNNALDAMKKNSDNMWIRAESIIKESEIIIKICDSGGGIHIDDIDSVFEKYVTTKEKTEDSGIGLYMCRQIAEKKLCGKISAYNSPEGACFELLLPIFKED